MVILGRTVSPMVILGCTVSRMVYPAGNLWTLNTKVEPFFFFIFTLVTGPRRSLSLELSDTRVYEPQIWNSFRRDHSERETWRRIPECNIMSEIDRSEQRQRGNCWVEALKLVHGLVVLVTKM